jgi:class 3 adenylate cyclase
MDVGDWLRGVGLGQYETLFRQNDIDDEILSDLTDGDLERFGVSFGHRKRLLKAIASLAKAKPGAKPATSVPPSTATDSAERRPITVMFCDLVGSTSLAAKLDPEDWRNLVGGYPDAASAAVTSLGGHVLKKLGDGLMALFGYPQAQENDGERAVRAALAIQRALADLNARNAVTGAPELATRRFCGLAPIPPIRRQLNSTTRSTKAKRTRRLVDESNQEAVECSPRIRSWQALSLVGRRIAGRRSGNNR